MLTSLRTVKDAGEAALIRKAVDASVAAHLAAMKAREAERQRIRGLRFHAVRVGPARLRAVCRTRRSSAPAIIPRFCITRKTATP